MARIKLSSLLGDRKMNIMDLHRITGTRYRTLTDYYHEMALSIKFEHIDKICSALGCSVGELIEYVPDRKIEY